MNAANSKIENPNHGTVSIHQKQELTEENKKRAVHFHFFGMGSIIYALFYTFCLYRNNSGITYPFFIGGTLFYFFLSLKKSGRSAKKDSVFYIVSLILLGISTCCTDAGNLIFMNKMGIFVLSFVLMIHNFCEDDKWNFSKYISAILQTVCGSLAAIGRPFSDCSLYLKSLKNQSEEKHRKRTAILLGIAVSIPLLTIVLMLLSSADAVFAALIKKLSFQIQLPENLFGILFSILFAFFASYCIITYIHMGKIKEETGNRRTGEPITAIIITTLLSIVYLVFSVIQIVYLFWGNMELPGVYTYADYAREGFFQLLFVCLLNLILVLICLGRFKESRVLKIILTVISVCTYIMIASSAMRMFMYIGFYFLTFLRIFVLWSLLVIFLLITGVLITIYKENFPLFRYSMMVVTALYLTFSFAHPDYWIAKYNTSHMDMEITEDSAANQRYYSDKYYLSKLSADAAPVLLSGQFLQNTGADAKQETDSIDTNDSDWWMIEYINKLSRRTEDMTLRNFNVSRFLAGEYLHKAYD